MKVFGIATSMVGIVIAGIVIAKLGILRALVLGSCMIIASNLGFAVLATTAGPTLVGLAAVNSLDNLALAMHGTSLIAYLSGLTSPKYTATQYALFSSFYALPGEIRRRILRGFVVDAIGYNALLRPLPRASGLPGLLLLYVLARRCACSQIARRRPLRITRRLRAVEARERIGPHRAAADFAIRFVVL